MKGNNLGKLNDLLFKQMERLDIAEKGEDLQEEVNRAIDGNRMEYAGNIYDNPELVS